MGNLTEVLKTLAGMPSDALVVTIILAAFALAAFAIHTVSTIAKRRR